MNNQVPFFNPYNIFPNNNYNSDNYERLENKIDRLEKNIRLLEKKVARLENNNKNDYINDEPTDMYMI